MFNFSRWNESYWCQTCKANTYQRAYVHTLEFVQGVAYHWEERCPACDSTLNEHMGGVSRLAPTKIGRLKDWVESIPLKVWRYVRRKYGNIRRWLAYCDGCDFAFSQKAMWTGRKCLCRGCFQKGYKI